LEHRVISYSVISGKASNGRRSTSDHLSLITDL